MFKKNKSKISSIRSIDSNRKARVFAVTVPYTHISKAHVFEALNEFCSQLVITEELHYNLQHHHHLFLRTFESYRRLEIRLMIAAAYNIRVNDDDLNNNDYDNIDDEDGGGDDSKIYVATVRNVQNYLGYITKEDESPMFKGRGVEKSFSFYYRSLAYANSVSEFDVTHPFVLNHPQYYKLLNDVVIKNQEKKEKLRQLNQLKPVYYCFTEEFNWQDKIISWWNDWAISGYKHKKQQLFVHGASNTGKTTFIMNLLKIAINEEKDSDEAYERQIFRPTPNEPKYAYQSFDSNRFNVFFIDEFDASEYKISDMKKALAGESFPTNCKNAYSKTIKIQMPAVLISNSEPPNEYQSEIYRGFRERLLIIEANQRFY